MGIYLLVATRNLLSARKRSALLGAALALVTALLVILQALSAGVVEQMRNSALVLVAGHVNVGGFYKTRLDSAMPVVLDAPKIKQIVEENTPGLVYVIDRNSGWSKLVSDTGSISAALSGIDPKQETRLGKALSLAKEADYKARGGTRRSGDLARLGEPKTVVLFADQAKRLQVEVGDMLTVTAYAERGAANSADLTVVAIAEEIGMLSKWNAFVAKETIYELYQQRSDTTGSVMVYIEDHENSTEVMAKLREVFSQKGYPVMDHEPKPFFQKFDTVRSEDWTGQKLDLTIWSDEISFVQWLITGLDVVTYTLIGILLVIIAIGIMNTMWIAVRERTGEVGTLRAIGMGKSRILVLFLTEALLLGLVSTGLGALLATTFCLAINAIEPRVTWAAARVILLTDRVHLNVSPGLILGAIGLLTLIAGLSALWPALRASRLQPVKAMNAAT